MTLESSVLNTLKVLLTRIEFVEYLDEQSADKPQLIETLDVSRSTVTRALRELETANLIERSGGEFSVSPFGHLCLSKISTLGETLESRQNLETVLQWTSSDALDVDHQLLASAEIIRPKPGDPRATVNRHVELLEGMTHYRVLLPFTELPTAQVVREQLKQNDAEVEAIVSPRVKEVYFSTPQYEDVLEDYLASERFEAFVCEMSFPYCLGIVDETAHIIVSENDEPRALLESTNETVLEWAIETFEEYKRDAEPIGSVI